MKGAKSHYQCVLIENCDVEMGKEMLITEHI